MKSCQKMLLVLFALMSVVGFFGGLGYLFYEGQGVIAVCLGITEPTFIYFAYQQVKDKLNF